jgi:hypothetical protein
MVMRLAVGNLERDGDLRKERLQGERFEIATGVEAQTIDPRRRRARFRHQGPLAAVHIGFSTPDQLPPRFMLPLEDDTDAGSRNAAGGIEDVGGDRAHEGAILAQSSRGSRVGGFAGSES